MKSKHYWVILIIVAILIGSAFLVVGGVFDKNNKNNFGVNNKINFLKTNSNSQNQENDNNSVKNYKPEQVDLVETGIDFEADPEDTNSNNESDDVKDFDQDETDFDSVDSAIY